MSSFGDLKYPADFAHFDFVDPKAPKGGAFSQIGPGTIYNQNSQTFNSLNSYILRGDAAQGMELTFASLMARAEDEPDAMYGLAARAVRISTDGLTYRFSLRPQARFHDGSPLTAHDVVFSLTTLKDQGHPIITQFLRDFAGCEAADDGTVVVRFAPKRARDVPLFIAGLPIFSRAYYSKRPFDETTLDIPLGSGPYQVGRFEAGRTIEYKRVPNWWGADLPVNRGRHNFDSVRYDIWAQTYASKPFNATAQKTITSISGVREAQPLLTNNGPVTGAAIRPDGQVLAVSGDDGAIHRWRPATGRSLTRNDSESRSSACHE